MTMLKLLRPVLQPFLRSHASRFTHALQQPRESQERLLNKIISNLAQTDYGRSLNIKASDDYTSFAAKAPIVDYDDLSDWMERQKRTEKQVLVAEPVLFYEQTSGSSGGLKTIPYTQALKDSFNRMFVIWVADLFAHAPPLRSGKTFISVSPAFQQPEQTAQGRAIGISDDRDYLNGWLRGLMNRFLVVPSAIKQLRDPTDFKRALAVLLLAEESLEVISIWNPSFLEVILDFAQIYRELLIDDLKRGFLRVQNMEFRFNVPDAKRLALLEEKPIDWQRVWAELKIISCWTSAHAAQAAERLRAKFPHCFLQGKGLLATEAPLTLPLIEAGGYVPMLTEVFFEFLDEAGNLRLLPELEAGRDYEIIITQQGGLYRYRLGDRVRATHRYQETMCLEFIGRSNRVCDLVGEKLNENFVRECLANLSTTTAFQILLPVLSKPPFYLLITDEATPKETGFAGALDERLSEAFHYRQARQLGQLQAARVVVVERAREIYFDYFTAKGMKFGDIKHQFLATNTADAERLFTMMGAQTKIPAWLSKEGNI